MRTPHLLRVAEGPEVFADLLRAVEGAGLRAGWLENSQPAPPADLGVAAELGVLRAVAVGESGAIIVKPRRGRPVLRDLLREHFRGCAIVLFRQMPPGGPADAPRLEGGEEGWRITFADGGHRSFGTEALVAALRRPSPWPTS